MCLLALLRLHGQTQTIQMCTFGLSLLHRQSVVSAGAFLYPGEHRRCLRRLCCLSNQKRQLMTEKSMDCWQLSFMSHYPLHPTRLNPQPKPEHKHGRHRGKALAGDRSSFGGSSRTGKQRSSGPFISIEPLQPTHHIPTLLVASAKKKKKKDA